MLRNWSTVKEASDHYGITRQRVHRLIHEGRFGQCQMVQTNRDEGNGYKAKVWLIPYPFTYRPQPNGRPKKEAKG